MMDNTAFNSSCRKKMSDSPPLVHHFVHKTADGRESLHVTEVAVRSEVLTVIDANNLYEDNFPTRQSAPIRDVVNGELNILSSNQTLGFNTFNRKNSLDSTESITSSNILENEMEHANKRTGQLRRILLEQQQQEQLYDEIASKQDSPRPANRKFVKQLSSASRPNSSSPLLPATNLNNKINSISSPYSLLKPQTGIRSSSNSRRIATNPRDALNISSGSSDSPAAKISLKPLSNIQYPHDNSTASTTTINYHIVPATPAKRRAGSVRRAHSKNNAYEPTAFGSVKSKNALKNKSKPMSSSSSLASRKVNYNSNSPSSSMGAPRKGILTKTVAEKLNVLMEREWLLQSCLRDKDSIIKQQHDMLAQQSVLLQVMHFNSADIKEALNVNSREEIEVRSPHIKYVSPNISNESNDAQQNSFNPGLNISSGIVHDAKLMNSSQLVKAQPPNQSFENNINVNPSHQNIPEDNELLAIEENSKIHARIHSSNHSFLPSYFNNNKSTDEEIILSRSSISPAKKSYLPANNSNSVHQPVVQEKLTTVDNISRISVNTENNTNTTHSNTSSVLKPSSIIPQQQMSDDNKFLPIPSRQKIQISEENKSRSEEFKKKVISIAEDPKGSPVKAFSQARVINGDVKSTISLSADGMLNKQYNPNGNFEHEGIIMESHTVKDAQELGDLEISFSLDEKSTIVSNKIKGHFYDDGDFTKSTAMVISDNLRASITTINNNQNDNSSDKIDLQIKSNCSDPHRLSHHEIKEFETENIIIESDDNYFSLPQADPIKVIKAIIQDGTVCNDPRLTDVTSESTATLRMDNNSISTDRVPLNGNHQHNDVFNQLIPKIGTVTDHHSQPASSVFSSKEIVTIENVHGHGADADAVASSNILNNMNISNQRELMLFEMLHNQMSLITDLKSQVQALSLKRQSDSSIQSFRNYSGRSSTSKKTDIIQQIQQQSLYSIAPALPDTKNSFSSTTPRTSRVRALPSDVHDESAVMIHQKNLQLDNNCNTAISLFTPRRAQGAIVSSNLDLKQKIEADQMQKSFVKDTNTNFKNLFSEPVTNNETNKNGNVHFEIANLIENGYSNDEDENRIDNAHIDDIHNRLSVIHPSRISIPATVIPVHLPTNVSQNYQSGQNFILDDEDLSMFVQSKQGDLALLRDYHSSSMFNTNSHLYENLDNMTEKASANIDAHEKLVKAPSLRPRSLIDTAKQLVNDPIDNAHQMLTSSSTSNHMSPPLSEVKAPIRASAYNVVTSHRSHESSLEVPPERSLSSSVKSNKDLLTTEQDYANTPLGVNSCDGKVPLHSNIDSNKIVDIRCQETNLNLSDLFKTEQSATKHKVLTQVVKSLLSSSISTLSDEIQRQEKDDHFLTDNSQARSAASNGTTLNVELKQIKRSVKELEQVVKNFLTNGKHDANVNHHSLSIVEKNLENELNSSSLAPSSIPDGLSEIERKLIAYTTQLQSIQSANQMHELNTDKSKRFNENFDENNQKKQLNIFQDISGSSRIASACPSIPFSLKESLISIDSSSTKNHPHLTASNPFSSPRQEGLASTHIDESVLPFKSRCSQNNDRQLQIEVQLSMKNSSSETDISSKHPATHDDAKIDIKEDEFSRLSMSSSKHSVISSTNEIRKGIKNEDHRQPSSTSSHTSLHKPLIHSNGQIEHIILLPPIQNLNIEPFDKMNAILSENSHEASRRSSIRNEQIVTKHEINSDMQVKSVSSYSPQQVLKTQDNNNLITLNASLSKQREMCDIGYTDNSNSSTAKPIINKPKFALGQDATTHKATSISNRSSIHIWNSNDNNNISVSSTTVNPCIPSFNANEQVKIPESHAGFFSPYRPQELMLNNNERIINGHLYQISTPHKKNADDTTQQEHQKIEKQIEKGDNSLNILLLTSPRTYLFNRSEETIAASDIQCNLMEPISNFGDENHREDTSIIDNERNQQQFSRQSFSTNHLVSSLSDSVSHKSYDDSKNLSSVRVSDKKVSTGSEYSSTHQANAQIVHHDNTVYSPVLSRAPLNPLSLLSPSHYDQSDGGVAISIKSGQYAYGGEKPSSNKNMEAASPAHSLFNPQVVNMLSTTNSEQNRSFHILSYTDSCSGDNKENNIQSCGKSKETTNEKDNVYRDNTILSEHSSSHPPDRTHQIANKVTQTSSSLSNLQEQIFSIHDVQMKEKHDSYPASLNAESLNKDSHVINNNDFKVYETSSPVVSSCSELKHVIPFAPQLSKRSENSSKNNQCQSHTSTRSHLSLQNVQGGPGPIKILTSPAKTGSAQAQPAWPSTIAMNRIPTNESSAFADGSSLRSAYYEDGANIMSDFPMTDQHLNYQKLQFTPVHKNPGFYSNVDDLVQNSHSSSNSHSHHQYYAHNKISPQQLVPPSPFVDVSYGKPYFDRRYPKPNSSIEINIQYDADDLTSHHEKSMKNSLDFHPGIFRESPDELAKLVLSRAQLRSGISMTPQSNSKGIQLEEFSSKPKVEQKNILDIKDNNFESANERFKQATVQLQKAYGDNNRSSDSTSAKNKWSDGHYLKFASTSLKSNPPAAALGRYKEYNNNESRFKDSPKRYYTNDKVIYASDHGSHSFYQVPTKDFNSAANEMSKKWTL